MRHNVSHLASQTYSRLRAKLYLWMRGDETLSSRSAAAVLALERLNISVRGPFVLPRGRIFVVGGCILTEQDVVSLHEAGRFEMETVRKFLLNQKNLQSSKFPKQRRSERLMLKLRLLMRAETPFGEHFQTLGSTVTVNAHGGMLESPSRLVVGQRMTLINPHSRKQVKCRVVNVKRPLGDTFMVAFEFEQRSPWFWPIAFPPLDWALIPESGG
jgi:hypothetical protein